MKQKKIKNPILTIGMPVFNDVQYIEKSLQSILNQTFFKFKLIISDDFSTDGSQQICESYARKDSRIEYIRQVKNIGISKNMQFLLSKSNTEYFMWAGDDDLYDSAFIEKLIYELSISKSISVFCNFGTIDEKDKIIKEYFDFNYSSSNRKQRLSGFIKNAHDAFGYGIFRTNSIRGVEFPTWWWPNKNSPYNNIYPTLCYYLTKGNYSHVKGAPLFYKRVKTGKNVHHVLTGENNGVKESFAFWIRRLNLVMFSFKMIKKASNYRVAICQKPYLIYYWFMIPFYKQFKLAFLSYIKRL